MARLLLSTRHSALIIAMAGSLFIVSAPSGAGKTSLVQGLLAADKGLRLSISYTTRPPRPGEVNGKDYHFVSRDTFEAMMQRGEFLESAEIYGNLYGTSQRWIAEETAAGKDIVLEIDWQGAAQVRKLFSQAVGIFILPPSLQVLEARLKGRGQDSAEVIQRRLRAAREEMGHVGEFSYVIINDRLEEALTDLVSIVRAERLKLDRQLHRHRKLLDQLK